MKYALIVRHAKAESRLFDKDDMGRALTDRGIKDIKLVADFITSALIIPDMIKYSPALRCKQTAEELAKYLGVTRMEQVDSLYEATQQDLMNAIENTDNAIDNVLIVGHNPSILRLAMHYKYGLSVPAGTVLAFQSPVDNWSLFQDGPPDLKMGASPSTLRYDEI